MSDRETINPIDERLKNILAKHQDILGVFYDANIFSLFIGGGKIHIEEACDNYYVHANVQRYCILHSGITSVFCEVNYL